MPAYLTFLLDLQDDAESRIVKKTLMFVPQPSRTPSNAFTWKVTSDARGVVVIRARVGGRLTAIGSARWDGELHDKKQRGTDVNAYQWDLVKTALAEAAALRAADPSSIDESLVENVPSDDARKLRPPPDEMASAIRKERQREREKRDPRRANTALVIGLGVFALATLGVYLGVRHSAKKTTKPVPVAEPVAAPEPPAPVSEPQPTVDPRADYMPGAGVDAAADPLAAKVASADNLEAAWALAKPQLVPVTNGEIAALQLTHYRLRWSDVEKSETSLAKVEKDAEEERGKRLCVDGTITRIERGDSGGRKVYRGTLETKDDDEVSFLVTGSTGELVKREHGRLCGIVTGTSNGMTAVYGMFDLKENRFPMMEKPD